MTISPNIAYHLRELAIARDTTSPRHVMPIVQESDRAILDIGCGIGQTLATVKADSGRCLVGLDIDLECLRYGRHKFPQIHFVSGVAEQLPFADGTFDLVVSRVTLPYAHIGRSLSDISRVLSNNGRIWLTLHSFAKARTHIWSAVRTFALKDLVFRVYVVTNGLLLHSFGREIRFPFNRRYESFQTASGIERSLRKAGFTDVRVEHGRHFICTASKGARS